MQLSFNISFPDLYTRDGLIKLDEAFLDYAKSYDESLFYSLIKARENASVSSQCHSMSSQYRSMLSQCLTLRSRKQQMLAHQMTDSQLIIDLSYLLDEFIAKLFNIEKETEELKKKYNNFAVIYKCKRLFVQRYALKKYTDIANIDIDCVTSRLSHFLTLPTTEKIFAEQEMCWFEDKEHHKEEIELAAQYAAWRVKNKQGILFSTHKKSIIKISYHSLKKKWMKLKCYIQAK